MLFHFKDILQHFKFMNWRIHGFVFWCHEQVNIVHSLNFANVHKVKCSKHGLRTPREEIAFTARPKIHSHSQTFRFKHIFVCIGPIFRYLWFISILVILDSHGSLIVFRGGCRIVQIMCFQGNVLLRNRTKRELAQNM